MLQLNCAHFKHLFYNIIDQMERIKNKFEIKIQKVNNERKYTKQLKCIYILRFG